MALTQAEIFEHVGRMTKYGFSNLINGDEFEFFGLQMSTLIEWAKEYRINGSFGTLADRTEAMKAAQRFIFSDSTGKDPDTDSHVYKNHWLDLYVPGESSVLEP